jgi:hypothetical protein
MAGVRVGTWDSRRAASPATCGVAMEVPVSVAYVDPFCQYVE